MDIQEIIDKLPDKDDRDLLSKMRSNVSTSPEGEQARTLLQMRMLDGLIEALNKNSASADKLACGLNWLTGIIAFAAVAGVVISIVQLCK